MDKQVSLKQVIIINVISLVCVTSLFLAYQVLASPNNSSDGNVYDASELNYQGTLMGSEGIPVEGTQDIIFALYNDILTPTPLWQESHIGVNAVPVDNGLFSVILGSLDPIPVTVWDESELYLGIKVGQDDEMLPRERISSVPNAASAGVAQMALAVADGAVGSNGFAPTWYKTHNSTHYENSTTTMMPTDSSITFYCEVDCTVLIMNQALVLHTDEGGRVDVFVRLDGTTVIRELSYPHPQGAFGQVNGYGLFALPAGTHTVEVLFANNRLSEGTAKFYGDSSGTWDYLYVMMFASD